MQKLFYDTETMGFHGPIALLQYAVENDEPTLYSPWYNSIGTTLSLIRSMMTDYCLVGFNLAFDHFHLCQMWTTLNVMVSDDPAMADELLLDHIITYAKAEPRAIFGPCLKPVSCLDLMLHAYKGPAQTLMPRKPITIRNVPAVIADKVIARLNQETAIPDIYFAKASDKERRWHKKETERREFVHIALDFAPSAGLKPLTQHIKGSRTISYDDIMAKPTPNECGYAPYALAICRGGDTEESIGWNQTWPMFARSHAAHWQHNTLARKYASDDVIYTRDLYHAFSCPPPDDVDSILACSVAAVRWRGYRIDREALKQLRDTEHARLGHPGLNSPDAVLRWFHQVCTPTERLAVTSTGKEALQQLVRWEVSEVCPKCKGAGYLEDKNIRTGDPLTLISEDSIHCDCNDGFVPTGVPHPIVPRVKELMAHRQATKRIELYDKLLKAGRFHASFRVIGTKSSRMAGTDDLNAQGINKDITTRDCFPLADEGYTLSGGDFAGFEVVLMEAAYSDPELRAALLTGKKIHAMFGEYLYPGMTYDQILKDKEKYGKCKNCVFTMGYGGNEHTLERKYGILADVAKRAMDLWNGKYKVWAAKREAETGQFQTMKQVGGLGTKVTWEEPAEYAESLFGFRRYFTLENQISRVLFNLANKEPWPNYRGMVMRRDREQTIAGATRTALYAAAFNIQSAVMRQAGNHKIQSSGAQITKDLQTRIWALQPSGIHPFVVIPMNVHDEILVPNTCPSEVAKIVKQLVDDYRPRVPLLEIEWEPIMLTWGDKERKAKELRARLIAAGKWSPSDSD